MATDNGTLRQLLENLSLESIVRTLARYRLCPMPIRYVYRDAEELLASEAVRRSLASELEARGMGDFEGAVDTVVAEHMKTSDAYQNMPTELDKQGFELHFRYGLLHILAASVPEDYHPVTQSDAFKNPSVIEPLDSEVFLSNNTE